MSARPRLGLVGVLLGMGWMLAYPLWAGGDSGRLTFLAAGQGDAVVYQQDGLTVLFDCGPRTDGFDAGRRIVVPELKRLGVKQINLLVMSHADFDHVGGLESVSDVFPIRRIVTTSEVVGDSRLAAFFREYEGELVVIEGSGSARLGELSLRFWKGKGENDNDRSLAVLGESGGASFLLSGDGEADYERELTSVWKGPVDVVKAGHHGSDGSNSTAWLEWFGPSHWVATVGRGNSYGHPATGAVDRATVTGARVWRTDRDGSVQFLVSSRAFVPVFSAELD